MPPAYRAQGFPPNTLMSKVHVGGEMGSESLAHAAGELQTQLLGSLEITSSQRSLAQGTHADAPCPGRSKC